MWKNTPKEIFIKVILVVKKLLIIFKKIKDSLLDLELGYFRDAFYSLIENSQYESNIMKLSKTLFQKNNIEKSQLLTQKLVDLI